METKAPTRKPRGFKIALIILGVLFLLFVGFLFLLPHILPVGTIKSIANGKARELANVEIDFKSLGFSWNGSVVLDGIVISPLREDGTPGDPLLTVDEGRANVGILPLLSGKITVNSVSATGFSLRVKRDENGKLNLPDLTNTPATPQAALPSGGGRMLLLTAAVAADTADTAPASANVLPPIELHRVDLKNGVISFEDAESGLLADVGVDFVRIDGGDINDPFVLAGRLLPYPDAPEKGEIPFTGRVALVKGYAFNPDGEASLEVNVNELSLHEWAEKLGVGDLLPSGSVNGLVKAGYSSGLGALSVSDMRLTGTNVGIGEGKVIAVPDTTTGLDVQFDPATGNLDITEMSLTNDITSVKGRGRVEEIYSIADTGAPVAAVEFAGTADFARATGYLTAQGLGVEGMPTLEGNGSFSGKAGLARRLNPSDPLTPTFALDFSDGNLGAREESTGISATVGLKGVGVRATAALADPLTAGAEFALQSVPVRAGVPQIGSEPVAMTLNGGLVANLAGDNVTAELRFANTVVQVPSTPWASAMTVTNPETRITFDLKQDAVTVQDTTFSINDVIRGGMQSGTFTGILAGNPRGQAVLNLQALLDHVREIFSPVIPEQATKLNGSLRAATSVKVENGMAVAVAQAEVDNAGAVLSLVPDQTQGEVETPKTSFVMQASANLDNPLQVTINALEVKSDGSTVRVADKGGFSMAGTFGGALVKVAGVLDVGREALHLSGLAVDLNGMNMVLGQNGTQVAGLSGGVVKLQGPSTEKPVLVPLAASGDFNLPLLDVGLANLVFYRQHEGRREENNFGNIRAQLGVDGYIGSEKQQLINLRTATFSSGVVGASSRGTVDLGSGALAAEYAAVMAPAGMSSLLAYLGLPPAMLSNLDVRGTLSWDGRELKSMGESKGQLQLSSGEVNPFTMAHDVSAEVNAAEKTLGVTIRRLAGAVNAPNGEAVATLAAQPSELKLSRARSEGSVDIRVNGSAGPTRQLLLGLLGVVPQLHEYSNMLNQAQAQGVYQAWLQLKAESESTLGLNMGGEWQGAALSLNGAPFLAEAQKLSAALIGSYAYHDNRIDISRLFFRSDSAVMQADGKAQAVLTTDQNQSITGVGNVNVDLSFVMGDLSRVPMVFPGVVPNNLGLAGRVNGAFKAGGDANDIRVNEGAVRFQGFQANPGGSLEVAIPDGVANFGAVMSLHPGLTAVGGPPSDFEVFRYFNISQGQAALTGAQLKGKPIDNMSAAFELRDGVLNLSGARLSIGGGAGGSAQASGTVDFNGVSPAVNLRLAARNMPLSEANSEIDQYARIESGVINLPIAEGQTAGVAFTGISEDEILRTVRLDNFNFATGPVVLYTGPVINETLDKFRGLMKMEMKDDDSRMITLKSIQGAVGAGGDGTIVITNDNPVNVIGDNTGDFRVWGEVRADHTMRITAAVVGKLENIMGFSLPNLIPNLRSGPEEDRNRFMAKLNENAAKEHYKIRLEGSLDNPQVAGIEALAGQLIKDVTLAAPGQIIGGVVDLGKDAPKAVLDAAGAILSAPGTVVNSPEKVIQAPEKALKGLGRAFGIGGRDAGSGGEEVRGQEQQEQQSQEGSEEGSRRLRLPFGIH